MDLKERLREFGRRYGFIPKTKEDLRDDFGYVDPGIKEIAYKAKAEIDRHFAEKEGVIPYHWHKVKVYLKTLPARIGGFYRTRIRDVFINKDLIGNNEMLKTVTKHELFHSVQEEAGTIDQEPSWKVEAEACVFTGDTPGPYRPWTASYIWRWGKRLMTGFRDRIRKVYDYFTEEELDGM